MHPRLLPLKDKYTEVLDRKLYSYHKNFFQFYFSFTNIVRECDILQEYQSLDVRTTPNRDEVKYVVLPRKVNFVFFFETVNNVKPFQNETLTMVTLGIGQDIKAEIKLNEVNSLPKEQIKFIKMKIYLIFKSKFFPNN